MCFFELDGGTGTLELGLQCGVCIELVPAGLGFCKLPVLNESDELARGEVFVEIFECVPSTFGLFGATSLFESPTLDVLPG